MASSPLPPPDASARAMAPETTDAQPARPDGERVGRRPRYGVRRAVVAGVLVGVVALAAVGIVVVTRDGDDGEDAVGDAPGWDRLVAIDQTTGEATVIGRDGRPGDTVDLGLGLDVGPVRFASGDTLIVSGDDEAAVADLASGDVRTVELPEGTELRRVRGTRELLVVAADPAGGPALVITADGDVDVNAAADLEDGRYLVEQMSSDPAGEAVLASELLTFQTVLVPLDGGDPTFFGGAGVALTADEVVTLERVGSAAEIVITPRDGGDERRIATTDLRGVAGTTAGGFVLVTEDGTVSTVDAGADEAGEAGAIDLADDARVEAVLPFPAIDRVLVDDGTRLHLVDALDGTILVSIDASIGLGGPIGDPAQRCAAVATDAGLSAFDLVTAEVSTATIGGVDRPTGASVDGCTLIAQTAAGTSILHGAEVVELPERAVVAAVAPDGSAVVTVDQEGNAGLLLLDVADEEAIALDAAEASTFVFVEE